MAEAAIADELSRKLRYAWSACRGLNLHRTSVVLTKVKRGHEEHGQRIEDIPPMERTDECADQFGYHMRYEVAGIPFDDPDLQEYRELAARMWDCVDRLEARLVDGDPDAQAR